MLAGEIVSEVICYPGGRLIFTLQNDRGCFFVRWTEPHWQPKQDDLVLVRGTLFSVVNHRSHSAQIDAAEINSLMGD